MSDTTPTLLDRMGGEENLRRTVDAFYASVLADPVLRPLFGDGQPQHVDHLTAFLAEVFGGRTRYSDELGGFPAIVAVHRGLAIEDEQRQRFIDLFDAAAEAQRLSDDPEIMVKAHECIVFGTEVAQVNSHAKTDDELHECREMPHWT